jgi:hypothetical protein
MEDVTTISASDSSFRLQPSSLPALLPVVPRVGISIRPGTMDDLPFMDRLQKMHSKQVGWMPTKQFEGKILAGHVLVAEVGSRQRAVGREEGTASLPSSSSAYCLPPTAYSPVGYLIGNDQYFKRDDVGIIYQINVEPGRWRGLVGASLLKAQFERSAWGCKLYCCWCAQDIEANRFWEAMGFVPLAYRAGSARKKVGSRQRAAGREEGCAAFSSSSAYCLPPTAYSGRVHIFWQKRIRQGDTTTPWWFPSQTSGGSIREDRIVLPIPPGTHWSDAKPLILPGEKSVASGQLPVARKDNGNAGSSTGNRQLTTGNLSKSENKPALLWFGAPKPAGKLKEKGTKPKRAKQKNDPRLVAAARELRDRWLEHVNATPLISQGKYDVSRGIAGGESSKLMLSAA